MNRVFAIGKMTFELSNFKAYLIITVLCFSIYGNTIWNEYSIDDPLVVTRNTYVKKGISGIPDILKHPYQNVYGTLSDYRPVAEVTLALEYQIFGENPHVSHFFNIVFYTILCCLVYQLLLCFKLDDRFPYLPLLITTFFAVHPVHTEVVASIKNREELLSMLFGIGALIASYRFYTNDDHKIRNFVFILLCMAGSVGSKLTGIPFLAVIVLMIYQFGHPLPIRRLGLALLLFIALLIPTHLLGLPYYVTLAIVAVGAFFLLRDVKGSAYNLVLVYVLAVSAFIYLDYQHRLGSRVATYWENPMAHNDKLSLALALALDTFWFYFKFMFVPFPFRYYYGTGSMVLHTFSDPILILTFVIHAVILAYGLYKLWKRELIGFLIICYFISIASYANIIAKYTGIVSERALFAPSFWFITSLFVFAFSLIRKPEAQKKSQLALPSYIWVVIAIFLCSYFVLTVRRNFNWKDYITLMGSDIEYQQDAIMPVLGYADILRDAGEKEKDPNLRRQYFEKAKSYYNHLVQVAPNYAFAYFGLGEIYRYEEGKVDSGCNYFYTSYLLDSSLTISKFQVARCAFERGANEESKKLLSELYARIPDDTFTIFYYAKVLYVTGDHDKAEKVNNELLKMNANAPYYYVNEGFFNNVSTNIPEAAKYFDAAIARGCRDRAILNFMIDYYQSTGETDKANSMRSYLM